MTILSVPKMSYNLIKKLSNKNENWKVRVRLSRMWEAINRKNLELISLDMVLIDEQVRFELRIYFVIFSLLNSHLKTKIVTNKLLI